VDRNDLTHIADQATDRFRLETLPQYLVDHEIEELAAWRRGERRLHTPDTSAWLAHQRDTIAAGARWWRVRILDYPLVDYSAWELFGYQENAAVGQETFVANRAWDAELADLREDFWIFDLTVVRMVYDEEGHFQHPEQRDNLQHYLDIRDRALRHAIPLADYLRKYEPDLIANPI
jgi:hypothetical protein